jgi:hypothetical protein
MSSELRTARRSSALLHALSTDFLLREQFITDPVGMFSEYIGGASGSQEVDNSANQVLYAIVSNSQTLSWLRERVAAPGQDLSDAALAQDLAKVVGSSGDEALAAALIRCGASSKASLEPALALLRTLGLGLRGLGQRARGTEFTPGTGTEFTPGTGTLSTPGTGTQATPGTGTLSTPGASTLSAPRAGTLSTPGTGTQATPGTGTLSTPGTGTLSTPGTGTLSTPGGILGRWGEFQITIEALVQYATQLRQAGALRETGFE